MTDFIGQYRRAYTTLGRPLKRRDATPEREIRAAEKRLSIRIPTALRDYYRVAGRAKDFHSVHDRLLAPDDWCIEKSKLVFMEENQAVVLYGTIAGLEPDEDSAAFMGANDDPIRWQKVNARCSVFLLVMLHWEAAFGGGMPHGGAAKVLPGMKKTLDRTWRFIGEINRMRAYQKDGLALCFLKWNPDWRVFVGSTTVGDLTAVATDMGLTWDGNQAGGEWDL